MILRDDFSAFLRANFQTQSRDDYCVNGIQVPGKTEIQKIAFGVSASRNFLKKAEVWGADAVFVHHGLFWGSGIRSINPVLKERLAILLRSDISLFAMHLPLDAHSECGNNAEIARAFLLENLEPHDIAFSGKLKYPLSFSDFSEQCTEIFGQTPNFAEDFCEKKIERVGICSGGGADWIEQCGEIDAFVTGECEEKHWHMAAEKGISLFSVGHFASERFGVRAFQKILTQHFPALELSFFDEPCPV